MVQVQSTWLCESQFTVHGWNCSENMLKKKLKKMYFSFRVHGHSSKHQWTIIKIHRKSIGNPELSGVVSRVAIWFYYRKAFATAFAVLSARTVLAFAAGFFSQYLSRRLSRKIFVVNDVTLVICFRGRFRGVTLAHSFRGAFARLSRVEVLLSRKVPYMNPNTKSLYGCFWCCSIQLLGREFPSSLGRGFRSSPWGARPIPATENVWTWIRYKML